MLLRIKQVAERLQCSSALVYALVAQRRLAHVRLGGKKGGIRVDERDLEAFILGNKTGIESEGNVPKLPKLKHLRVR